MGIPSPVRHSYRCQVGTNSLSERFSPGKFVKKKKEIKDSFLRTRARLLWKKSLFLRLIFTVHFQEPVLSADSRLNRTRVTDMHIT